MWRIFWCMSGRAKNTWVNPNIYNGTVNTKVILEWLYILLVSESGKNYNRDSMQMRSFLKTNFTLIEETWILMESNNAEDSICIWNGFPSSNIKSYKNRYQYKRQEKPRKNMSCRSVHHTSTNSATDNQFGQINLHFCYLKMISFNRKPPV